MNLSEITASLLAVLTTVGFFAVLAAILYGLPTASLARDLANMMLGSLTTVWIMVMSYYYSGSTSSGKRSTGRGDVTVSGGSSPDSTRTSVLVDQQPVQTEDNSDSGGTGK